jgi:RNA polymerase sigma-70 factor (ECF subfamily)
MKHLNQETNILESEQIFNEKVVKASIALKSSALRFTKNKDAANDLIQDTIVKAISKKDKFQIDSDLQGWMYIIMKNTYLQKQHKEKRYVSADETNEKEVSTYNNSNSCLAAKEIVEAIKKLDKSQRKAFMMFAKGFKYEEIAEELQVPIGTIKSRIHNAKKHLAIWLKDYAY